MDLCAETTPLLPMWLKGLTPELVERAVLELGETPETKKQALEELKRLIDKEDGFVPMVEDAFLVRFLRARKYDVNRAFKTLYNYYAYKAKHSGRIMDFNPSDVKHILEMNKFMLPNRDASGGGIMITHLGSFDSNAITAEEMLAAGFVVAELGMDTEASQVCGSSLIVDMTGITLGRMRQYSSPSAISMLVRGINDCLPYRINAVHCVNAPSYFSFTYNIIRPMLRKKLRDRVHFHNDSLESLYQYIPKESLPVELGGHLTKKDYLDFRSIILSQEHITEKLNKYIFQGVKSKAGENSISYKPQDSTNLNVLTTVPN